ncbi:hypothetical protein NDU88_001449 [Pleurodeles waltl]|uniref:Uncharacterized protein n=1 Tax=Pleurodeles waltl TaxID=8319 RepID=A0AAV7LXP1_PLEWA|nr:hypothetical protein NDU88_001449 [Pleurodeles waltl]
MYAASQSHTLEEQWLPAGTAEIFTLINLLSMRIRRQQRDDAARAPAPNGVVSNEKHIYSPTGKGASIALRALAASSETTISYEGN